MLPQIVVPGILLLGMILLARLMLKGVSRPVKGARVGVSDLEKVALSDRVQYMVTACNSIQFPHLRIMP